MHRQAETDGDQDHSATAAGESAEAEQLQAAVQWEVAVLESGHEPLRPPGSG